MSYVLFLFSFAALPTVEYLQYGSFLTLHLAIACFLVTPNIISGVSICMVYFSNG